MQDFEAGLAGRVTLVTGGASGIGLATARRLRAEGAQVVIADIDEGRGKGLAAEIGADFVNLDVSDAACWQSAVESIVERHGGLDLAFLNAGVVTMPPSSEGLSAPFDITAMSDDRYRRVMGANVDGVILGTRAVVPAMRARGGGAIVATASAAGVVAFPPDPVYTATKHAVVGFVRSLAPVLEADGISINAILPGVVDTRILTDGFAERARAMGIAVIPPEKIAEAVAMSVKTGRTGQLWVCLADRDPYAYQHEPVDGLGIPSDESPST